MKLYVATSDNRVGPFFTSKDRAYELYREKFQHAKQPDAVAQFFVDLLTEVEADNLTTALSWPTEENL